MESIMKSYNEGKRGFKINFVGNSYAMMTDGILEKFQTTAVGPSKPIGTTKNESDINTLYTFGKIIGDGGYGSVYEAQRIKDGTIVAVKVVPKEDVEWSNEGFGKVPDEVLMLSKCQDIPGVIKYYEYFETYSDVCIVQEKPSRAINLLHYIGTKGYLEENHAKDLFSQVVDTVCAIHQAGIVHRDIKSDNIIVDLDSENKATIKIIDFGLATYMDEPYTDLGSFGTLYTKPPEMLSHNMYPPGPATVWTLGLLLHNMFHQLAPYTVTNNKHHFHHDWKEGVPMATQHLLEMCLQIAPTDRPSLEEIQNHPWLKKL